MQVRNTDAEGVTEALNRYSRCRRAALLRRRTSSPPGISDVFDGAAAGRRGATGRIVADPNRNLILFHGSGREWAATLEVVRESDKPVPPVLIEVMVAEITLRDDEGSGLEFGFRGVLKECGLGIPCLATYRSSGAVHVAESPDGRPHRAGGAGQPLRG